MDDIDTSALDPGIRDLVVALRAAGFETTDSGDGVSKGGNGEPFAHVAVTLGPLALVSMTRAWERAIEACRLASRETGRSWTVQLSAEVGYDNNGMLIQPSVPILGLLVDTEQFQGACEVAQEHP